MPRYVVSFDVSQTLRGVVDVELEATDADTAVAIAKGRLIGAAAGGDEALEEYHIDWDGTGVGFVNVTGMRRVIER